ncbi:hypothetical protein ACU4GD_07355 [Cupriavidus basilensis]
MSVSSVSNVLNGRTERLNPATFERVQEAIRTPRLPSQPGCAPAQDWAGRPCWACWCLPPPIRCTGSSR